MKHNQNIFLLYKYLTILIFRIWSCWQISKRGSSKSVICSRLVIIFLWLHENSLACARSADRTKLQSVNSVWQARSGLVWPRPGIIILADTSLYISNIDGKINKNGSPPHADTQSEAALFSDHKWWCFDLSNINYQPMCFCFYPNLWKLWV